MRIELKPHTVERIERLAEQKMTTRCDKVINKALDAIEQKPTDEPDGSPQVKLGSEILGAVENG